MKNFFLVLVSILFIFSCGDSKKFEGNWEYNYRLSKDKNSDSPHRILIKNDSIKFIFWNFMDSELYPLRINGGKFNFKNLSIPINLIKDTLILKGVNSFVRYNYNNEIKDEDWNKPITTIDLPGINNEDLFKSRYSFEDMNHHILFGRRRNNKSFVLQLNDNHAKISDIPMFIAVERASKRYELIPFPISVLYIDKSSPMEHVEAIFIELKRMNQLKTRLINSLDLNFNDTLGIYYDYEFLDKRLPPYRGDDNYKLNYSKKDSTLLPPPPPYYPLSYDKKLEPEFILLKQNQIYWKDQTTTISELRKLIKPLVIDNKIILSLYDLESSYGEFLELNAIINSVYQEVRESISKEKFNLPLKELSRKQLYKIREKIPMRHMWSYSIPHFNHVIKENGSFFGLEVDSIK